MRERNTRGQEVCDLTDLDILWADYKESKDPALREDLILHYASLVKQVIGRLVVNLPPYLEYEDLLSYGIMGLIDALDRFDLRRGTKFETYARLRIKGQVIDALRSLGLAPRSARDKAKEIEKNLAHLRQELGRTPTDHDIAQEMGMSLGKFHRILTDASCSILSLDRPLSYDDEGKPLSLGDVLEDDTATAPAVEVQDMELLQVLREAIQELAEREQLLIYLYYNEELTMKEIGRVLEVSESRVCQIHSKIIFTVRARLQEYLRSGLVAEGAQPLGAV
jgi:RNA polymerase sigma factor for flagellar operon FliA